MSAFIVSRKHVDYLVTSGLRYGQYGPLRWLVPAPKPEGCYERGEPLTEEGVDFARQQSRELRIDTASRVGCMLWAENYQSVNHRYDENAMEQEVYEYDPLLTMRTKVDPVQVLKAIACFRYQSCEHPEWEHSEAYAFCDALEKAAINALPGYEDAEWEIA